MIAAPLPAAPGAPALVLTDPLPALPAHWWENPLLVTAAGAGAAAVVAVIVAGVWILKNKPAPSAASVALADLEKAEGVVAVTGVLRAYLAAVSPALHTGLTLQELENLARAGAHLPAGDWSPLLRACDETKYAGGPAPGGLRDRAKQLILDSEKHLAARREWEIKTDTRTGTPPPLPPRAS